MRPLALLMLTACTEGGSVACTDTTAPGLRYAICAEASSAGEVVARWYEVDGREYPYPEGEHWHAADAMVCAELGVCPQPCEVTTPASMLSAVCG